MDFEKNPEQQEQPKLSLLENFDTCVNAIVEVEAGYQNGRLLSPEHRSIIQRAMRDALEDLQRQQKSITEEGKSIYGSVKARSGFQGIGGFNRYEVLESGAIMLSRSHTVAACRKKAVELGIGITDY